MSDALDPGFDDLLRLTATRYGAEQGYTDIPGKVLTYDAATQTAQVQPLVLVPRNGTLRQVGILHQVQVRWPAGSTWSIVGELVAGDFGWLRFAGADISAWKMQATELDPTALQRSGAASDAYFEPGSQPVSVPLAADAYSAGALVVKAVSLLLGDSTATLAAARDTDPVTLSSGAASMLTWMSQVETFINGLVLGTVNPLSSLIPYAGEIEATTTKVKIS